MTKKVTLKKIPQPQKFYEITSKITNPNIKKKVTENKNTCPITTSF